MTPYHKEIEIAAATHGIEADLLEALVITESNGQADAFRYEPAYYKRYVEGRPEYAGMIPRRVASSYGLTQIMYPTALQYGFDKFAEPELLFLPRVNLNLGAKILKALRVRFGSVESALQAYNGGPGNVGSAQTMIYSRKVLGHRADLRRAVDG